MEISKEEYIQLRTDSEKLSRLESAGVDNWTWYDDAIFPDDRPDMRAFEEDLRKQLENK